MGYAKYVGRVGALAVALGVATAVASTPPIAYAKPSDASSASDTSDGSPSKSDSDPAATETDPAGDSPSAEDGDRPAVTTNDSGDDTDAADLDAEVNANALDDADTDDADAKATRSTTKRSTNPGVRRPALLDRLSDLADTVVPQRSDLVDDLRAAMLDRPTTAVTRPSAGAPVRALRAAAVAPVAVEDEVVDTVNVATGQLTALGRVARGLIPGLPEDLPSPALWAMAAFARRELGAGALESPQRAASPAIAQVMNELAIIPEPGGIFEVIINALADLRNGFVNTFTRPSPVANELQFTTDTGAALTDEFDASAARPDDKLVYFVNDRDAPGGPKHGTVVVDGNTFTYTPDADFTGTDTFTYVASDDTGFPPHIHLPGALNSAFGVFGFSFGGDHRATNTVTVFVGDNATIPPRIENELTIVTYNIADLPFPLNFALNDETVLPRFTGTAEISRRLNALHEADDGRAVGFDIANLQEDFAWHPIVIWNTLFPNATPPEVPDYLWPIGVPFIAGLNSLTKYSIQDLQRIGFTDCGSFNCLTPKGFTYSQIQLPGGETIDVYNLHTDSGSGARTNDQILQVSQYIQRNSAGRAVIVTGDWNQLYSEENEVLTQFAAENGLTDAWVLQEYGGVAPTNADQCHNTNACEQLDKIMYRSSAETIPGNPASRAVILELLRDEQDPATYVGYQNFGLAFQAEDGTPLSDHRPVAATLTYSTLNNRYVPPAP